MGGGGETRCRIVCIVGYVLCVCLHVCKIWGLHRNINISCLWDMEQSGWKSEDVPSVFLSNLTIWMYYYLILNYFLLCRPILLSLFGFYLFPPFQKSYSTEFRCCLCSTSPFHWILPQFINMIKFFSLKPIHLQFHNPLLPLFSCTPSQLISQNKLFLMFLYPNLLDTLHTIHY